MRRRAAALAIAGVAIAAMSTSTLMSPVAAAPDRDHGSGPVISGHPETFEVTRSPAPRTVQRLAAGRLEVYPIPTSAAGLQRITTAPDGSMWFVEQDKNKIGRITTSGAITEINLPPQTTSESWVKDLDVDSAGNVWVVWDQGWKVTRYDPGTNTGYTWTFDYPYGEEVRVGPNATAWVTASYDEDGIVRISGDTANWDANAPECDGALGRGRDGLMWCQQFDKLIRVNAAGNGGTSFPLPSNATYPYSVATGPNNKIWFGRDSGGSMFSSPQWGNIGWIGNDNQAHVIRTGDRTAPRSLVTGKDGNVWFVSVGAAKGIGHVSPAGVGAVAKVGNYKPTSLTYGTDGAIWFTDSGSNSIVRVARSHLWQTNLDVGPNSQLRVHPQPKLTFKTKRVDANKRRTRGTFKIACGSGLVPCSGKIVVKKGRKTVATGSYSLPQRQTKKVSVNLNKVARKQLKKSSRVKVTITLSAKTGHRTKTKGTLTR